MGTLVWGVSLRCSHKKPNSFGQISKHMQQNTNNYAVEFPRLRKWRGTCTRASRGWGHVFSEVRHDISAGIDLPFRKHAIVSVRPEEEPVESSAQVPVARRRQSFLAQ